MSHRLLPITAADYERHSLHRSDRIWTETNCYVDVWIEVLHACGLDPLAAAAFPLSTGFEGDQWTFFKYPPEDLRALYGIEVSEMNVWRPVLDHLTEQLDFGRLLTIEVDSFFLPDTHGVSYRIAHVKSTIVANEVDTKERRLGYFHNAGYFELSGDDFDGLFHRGAYANEQPLPPYVELVKMRPHETVDVRVEAERLLARHLDRACVDNPIPAMAAKIERDMEWLRTEDGETFHQYAFGICRQCGASAELAADFLCWLADCGGSDGVALFAAAEHLRSLAQSAKALQFALARMARGRPGDISSLVSDMQSQWSEAYASLRARGAA